MNKRIIWYNIPKHPDYKINEYGDIISFKGRKPRLLQPILNQGYLRVKLYTKGSIIQMLIHIAVAIVFHDHKSGNGINGLLVDHKDNDTLNNHKTNIQLTTNRINLSKDKWRKGKSSKYTGVCWNKQRNKWQTNIYYEGKLRHLGLFNNEFDAKIAYDNELKKILQL